MLEATFKIRGVQRNATRLGLGGAPTGGHGWGPRDDRAAMAAIVEAHRCGITFFDTADVYGLGVAERLLGNALSRCKGMRSTAVIATKGGVAWDSGGRTVRDSSQTHLRSAIEGSLRRLGLDTVDLYYLHWADGTTPLCDSIGELVRFREEGKTRAIGICNVEPQQLAALDWAGLGAVQVKGNLLEPSDMLDVSSTARSLGAVVVCSSALADGLLSGAIPADRRFDPDDHRSRYPLFQPGVFEVALEHVNNVLALSHRIERSPASVALRWLLQSGAADAVLSGSTSARHIADNATCLDFELTAADVAWLGECVPLETGERRHR